jgi:hypothetical protein
MPWRFMDFLSTLLGPSKVRPTLQSAGTGAQRSDLRTAAISRNDSFKVQSPAPLGASRRNEGVPILRQEAHAKIKNW